MLNINFYFTIISLIINQASLYWICKFKPSHFYLPEGRRIVWIHCEAVRGARIYPSRVPTHSLLNFLQHISQTAARRHSQPAGRCLSFYRKRGGTKPRKELLLPRRNFRFAPRMILVRAGRAPPPCRSFPPAPVHNFLLSARIFRCFRTTYAQFAPLCG